MIAAFFADWNRVCYRGNEMCVVLQVSRVGGAKQRWLGVVGPQGSKCACRECMGGAGCRE